MMVVLALLMMAFAAPAAWADDFTVTNTGNRGSGTLHQAILDANATPNDPLGPDVIKFDIPTTDGGYDQGTGVYTISLTTFLPLIRDPVTIDGYTQQGAQQNTLAQGSDAKPVIELDGTSAGDTEGVLLAASNCTIKGLVINRFSGGGILIYPSTSGNVVEGNFIGTEADGATLPTARPLAFGVAIDEGSNNTIGGTSPEARNVISGAVNDGVNGFTGSGVYIQGAGATGNKVTGNYIGTNAAGTSALPNVYGVKIADASSNTVGGTASGASNVISGNSKDGVDIDGSGASGNEVAGNYIGIDATGREDLGNSRYGVWVKGPNNTIGGTASGAGNVISGNDDQAVYIYGNGASGNEVAGNYIGTDATGQEDVGNSRSGVYVEAPDNRVGGAASGARNVISGNGHQGVALAASGNEVAGNYIGTDATGQNDLGNARMGVLLLSSASNSIIGGTAEGASNVISGNDSYGLFLSSSDSKAEGNYIGTDVTGREDLGNSDHGVAVLGPNNTVGGTVSGARNVISGNGKPLNPDNPHDGAHGVIIFGSGADGNEVEGNYVGTDATGQEDVGNSGIGVAVLDGDNNTVGGTAAGAPNVMAFNGRDGAAVVSPSGTNTGNAILSNSIFSNGHLGIDLGVAAGYDDGFTPNDPGDADPGPNGLQNFPELSSVSSSNGTTTIEGTLDSTPSSTFTVQLFSSPEEDPSGHGEGKKYLGQQSVTTDPSGKGDISFTTQDVSAAGFVSATATASNSSTSEFSNAVVVNAVPRAGTRSVTTGENEAKKITLSATDADGEELAFEITDQPSHGVLGPIGPVTCEAATKSCMADLTYTPDKDYSGIDSFSYKASDGKASSQAARVQIAVEAVSEPDPTPECTIKGTRGKDVLRGTARRDVICAYGGDDTIRGMAGNDLVMGGAGEDAIQGNEGDDTIYGGDGKDTIQGNGGDDTIHGGSSGDVMQGNDGRDKLYGGSGDDTIQGGAGNDLLNGGSGTDVTQQ